MKAVKLSDIIIAIPTSYIAGCGRRQQRPDVRGGAGRSVLILLNMHFHYTACFITAKPIDEHSFK